MKLVPGSRYHEGLVIAEWNSYIGSDMYAPDGVSSPSDHIIKRLVVKAEEVGVKDKLNLVGFIEVEVVSIVDGVDEGHFELPVHRVYQLPFPDDVQVRKQVLRQMQKSPSLH